MTLSAKDIEGHIGVRSHLRLRAAKLLEMHVDNPRSAGIFATHQRWLLAHLGLAEHFESALAGGPAGMYASTVATRAVAEGVSSRNTAEAFLREMVKYGFIEVSQSVRDRRIRWLTVSSFAVRNVVGWLAANLATLDALDGRVRAATFLANPSMVTQVEPVAARGFLLRPRYGGRDRRSCCLPRSTRAAP